MHSRGRPRFQGFYRVPQPRQRLNKSEENSTAAAVVEHSWVHFTADDRGYARLNHCRDSRLTVAMEIPRDFETMTPDLLIFWLIRMEVF